MNAKNIKKFLSCMLATTVLTAMLINPVAYASNDENSSSLEVNTMNYQYQPRYGLVARKKLIDTKTITRTITPGNQKEAINFKTPHSGVYIGKGGPYVSFSIGVGYKPVSFGISAGYVSKNQVTGVFVGYPPDGKNYIVKDDVKMKVRIYKVDYYDQEKGKVIGSDYEAVPEILGHSYYLVRR